MASGELKNLIKIFRNESVTQKNPNKTPKTTKEYIKVSIVLYMQERTICTYITILKYIKKKNNNNHNGGRDSD